ncbi:MAG: hypothetical protein RIR01_1257, partial [Bacteroidota bacterium]
ELILSCYKNNNKKFVFNENEIILAIYHFLKENPMFDYERVRNWSLQEFLNWIEVSNQYKVNIEKNE